MKTVSESAVALQTAVEANRFGVMQVHNFMETMTKKGLDEGNQRDAQPAGV